MTPMGSVNSLVPAAGSSDAPFFPRAASTIAPRVDAIYLALNLLTLVIVLLIVGMSLRFMIKYYAGSKTERTHDIKRTSPYEWTWIGILFVISICLYTWAAWGYFDMSKAPANATVYYVTGQQWWWEIQHTDGRREMNQFHVPVNQPVRLLITSKDVIHSFYVPAFRVKQDAVPGRYTSMWFTPTKPGQYHLFCAEYCGADHARMVGTVFVMSPADYADWLLSRPPAPTPLPLTPTNRTSFRELGCDQCHRPETNALAPYLEGLFGTQVTLSDGTTVIADENYIRESILDPGAKIVRGYMPIMPTYKGQLTEKQLMQLVEAVRGLEKQTPERNRK